MPSELYLASRRSCQSLAAVLLAQERQFPSGDAIPTKQSSMVVIPFGKEPTATTDAAPARYANIGDGKNFRLRLWNFGNSVYFGFDNWDSVQNRSFHRKWPVTRRLCAKIFHHFSQNFTHILRESPEARHIIDPSGLEHLVNENFRLSFCPQTPSVHIAKTRSKQSVPAQK